MSKVSRQPASKPASHNAKENDCNSEPCVLRPPKFYSQVCSFFPWRPGIHSNSLRKPGTRAKVNQKEQERKLQKRAEDDKRRLEKLQFPRSLSIKKIREGARKVSQLASQPASQLPCLQIASILIKNGSLSGVLKEWGKGVDQERRRTLINNWTRHDDGL